MNTLFTTLIFLLVIISFIIAIYRDKERNDFGLLYVYSLIIICIIYIAFIITINEKYRQVETKSKPTVEFQIITTQLNDSIIERDTTYTYKFKNN